MATLSYTASAADLQRLADAVSGLNGYQATIGGQPNPETKAQFSKRWQIREWKRLVVQYEKQLAIAAVVAGVADPVNPDIT